MRLGIDFGSTYSTISRYDPVRDTVEAVTMQEGDPASIPSVVSINKRGMVTCGQGAKMQAGKKNIRLFEAFKMLLTEQNETLLQERGYDSQYTPRAITAKFLEHIISGALKRSGGGDTVENLVICVPEIWSRGVTARDGRYILRDLLYHEIGPKVEHVRVVTEPEAASAYFAYNYEKETGKTFNGHLLLIDYGGGTLDITLTEVASDGKGGMEIAYREGGGDGENHRDAAGTSDIGCAGIAYMQNVVLLALRDQGYIAPDETPNYASPAFVGAVHELEIQLRVPERIEQIEDTFGVYGSFRKMDEILEEEPTEFVPLDYDGEELIVTFHHLFRAYQQVIEPVVRKEISKINASVQQHIGADPTKAEAGVRDDFKIALVGGFGSFYLVKAQISEIYNLDYNSAIDLRTKSINASQRELAISLGAALVSAKKIELRKTARHSIGLATVYPNKKIKKIYYGIKYHQNVETDTFYYLLTDPNEEDKGYNRATWAAMSGNIEYLMIEWSDAVNCGTPLTLKAEMLERLKRIPEGGLWQCAFSMDDSDVFSIHVVPVTTTSAPDKSRKVVDITLESFARMFEMTEAKRICTDQ